MKTTKKYPFLAISMAVLFALMMSAPTNAAAETTSVNLGAASTYAVLAAETITNTGTSTIGGSAGGDVGLYAGTSITGVSTLTISGTFHAADATANLAKIALSAAYDDAAGRTPVITRPAELGGSTLKPGVYVSDTGEFQITGTLTLDGEGNNGSVFIFKAGSTLKTANGSNVKLINGARVCNIVWQVGSSATLGTNSKFSGRILASSSITATTGANVQGQLLAKTGSVTLDTNNIQNVVCTSAVSSNGALPNTASPLYTVMLMGAFMILAGVVALRIRKRHE